MTHMAHKIRMMWRTRPPYFIEMVIIQLLASAVIVMGMMG